MTSTSIVSMAMPLLNCTPQKKQPIITEPLFKPLPILCKVSKAKFVVKASDGLKQKVEAAAGLLAASMVVPDVAKAADAVVSPPLAENLLLGVAVLTAFAAVAAALYVLDRNSKVATFNRSYFPDRFLFGAGSSAYQIEGAWDKDGKGPSVWDTYTHSKPAIIPNNDNGDVAIDFYNRYKEDIALAKSENMDAFRFSIAWARILPQGKLSKGINKAGIDFYNRVIDEIIAQGIKPCATLFHWDTPQALEDEYLGFLSPKIIDDFADYADICFHHFGDRVKNWTTMNEPHTYATTGYDYGIGAPNRCSYRDRCAAGNSSTEPYQAAHYLLLAHAAGNKLYQEKYKAKQMGELGIVINSEWSEPYSNKAEDKEAAQRGLDFMLGWYMHPVVYGDYPENMKRLVGTRLPKFTQEESQLLKGSYDFIGINYYTSNYAQNATTPGNPIVVGTLTVDSQINKLYSRGDLAIGSPTGSAYNFSVPWGLTKLLNYVRVNYNNPRVYITECGMAQIADKIEDGVNDVVRVKFLETHLMAALEALKLGSDIKGFLTWSFHDNFEWYFGYTQRYGINFIDYKDNYKRYPKKSALWFKEFLREKSLF